MRKVIIELCFLFVCSMANAEQWVCQQGSNLVRKQGDGLSLGIATVNYATIDANCIMATELEYSNASLPNKKLDKSIVTGSRVVDMTAQEITDREQAILNAQSAAKIARLQAIDDKIAATDLSIVLTKADTAIDNIGNLNDAKVFLKKLVRYVVASQSND